jgi:4-hydroxy-tetrahydrodipicolinate synthase
MAAEMVWRGVMPALTTAFKEDLTIDHAVVVRHVRWLVEAGCTGVVLGGSLGEAATLRFEEKAALWQTAVGAVEGRVPIVAGIAALSTPEAVEQARAAAAAGCRALMVLPPYVYRGDWREMKAHVEAVFQATPLSCMLYNNPIAYGTDFTPEQIHELAHQRNFHAVKESSADVRRVTAIRALVGDRLRLFLGVDDLIVEGVQAGAVGWIAGLVNAFPRESVLLFEHAEAGRVVEAESLYRWFLPLLRLDTVPKFVQLIKWVQQEMGMGSARVRPPRLELAGRDLEEAQAVLQRALALRPVL